MDTPTVIPITFPGPRDVRPCPVEYADATGTAAGVLEVGSEVVRENMRKAGFRFFVVCAVGDEPPEVSVAR